MTGSQSPTQCGAGWPGALPSGARDLEGNMSEPTMRQIVLASRPSGPPTPGNFRLEELPMPAMPSGGLLLRVLYLSLDPYMRGRMDDRKSYAKSVSIGEPMTGE